MWRYVVKRLLLIFPILLGVSFIVYGIISMTPGDPASSILGTSATQDQIDQLNHELGYDQHEHHAKPKRRDRSQDQCDDGG